MDRSILKAWLGNGAVLAAVTAADAETLLKCAVLAATLLYTLLRCWKLASGKPNSDKLNEL